MHDSPMSLLRIYDGYIEGCDNKTDCIGTEKLSKDTVVYRLEIIK